MQQGQKIDTVYLTATYIFRNNQSNDLTLSINNQKQAIGGIIRWLLHEENIFQLSHIGKNLIVRYNWKNSSYKTSASKQSVRLDCQGKKPQCRFYIQQDEVKGKTNLGQIYISVEVDKVIQYKEPYPKDSDKEYQTKKKKIQMANCIRQEVKQLLKKFLYYSQNKIEFKSTTSPTISIQFNKKMTNQIKLLWK